MVDIKTARRLCSSWRGVWSVNVRSRRQSRFRVRAKWWTRRMLPALVNIIVTRGCDDDHGGVQDDVSQAKAAYASKGGPMKCRFLVLLIAAACLSVSIGVVPTAGQTPSTAAKTVAK